MKKILVCGGAGFIGSNFIKYFLKKYKNAKILNYDKLTYSGNLDNLKDITKDKRYYFIKGDIANKKQLEAAIKKFKPYYIINFAAETHVDKSIHIGAKEFINTNITGVFNILEEVKNNSNIKKYVQVSTDEVFGSLPLKSNKKAKLSDIKYNKKLRTEISYNNPQEISAFKEDTAFAPNVPYAATKAGGDLLCRAYFQTFNIPVVVTHCSNNYGFYQYPEKLIPFFIIRMLGNKKLPIYGDGKNVRDWIYVLDHCRALELCLLKGKAGEVYNIGADNEKNNLEIAKIILDYFKKNKSNIEFVSDRPGHDRRYSVDSSKIRKTLGWKPKYEFKKAIVGTIKWYVENTDWVENVRKRTGVFNPHIDLWRKHSQKIHPHTL